MASKAQATKQAAQQAKKIRKSVADNLVELDENALPQSNPGELNQKIGQIDTDLDGLRKELETTNKGLMSNLTQLNEKDTDLRSKVSEAYQQLGELESAYRSLTDKSADINREIKAVSKHINEVNKKAESDIGSLSEEHGVLVNRVEELAAKSKKTTQDLNKSIKANAKAMLELEKNLLTEIDDLANASKSRDEDLDKKTEALAEGLNRADAGIQANQARLIKMQAIDQALEKRAQTLETITSELTRKSRELSRSTTTLNQRTQQLSEAVRALQATSEEHSHKISGLQQRAEKTANALFALIMREKRHFRGLAASLAILLIGFLGFLVYDQANWQQETVTNSALQAGISLVRNDLAVTDNRVTRLDNGLGELQQQAQAADAAVKEEISTINQKLTTIGDQVDSLDGRLTNLRPHKQFGNDNVIHGPEWLASQTAGQYVIHLATLNEKQALYDLAERYHRYLKHDLAYLPVKFNGSRRFALLYGRFSSEAAAASALSRMPRYIERQRPAIYPVGRIQRYSDNKPERSTDL